MKLRPAQKIKLCRIAVSAVIFILSLILPINSTIKFISCLAAYIISAYDILFDAAANIFHGQFFDEKFLMALASVGAFAIGEYHEAVFVTVFFQIGELFESIAVGKSRDSVAALINICPEYANIERDGELLCVDPALVNVGDIIVVKPGEKIPLDGTVVSGASDLNTAALTGEAMPRSAGEGDSVFSGCINLNGLLKIEVSKSFENSTVSKIMELVEQSAANKSKSENFITQFARWYTPAVVICALVLAIVPSVFIGNWSEWIHRSLTFLVISCPCALVISVPLTYFGGIGKASRHGILVKGSNYLDALARCSSFVFDKTGTLTHGNFTVKKLIPINCSKDELVKAAALAESYSNHPIALSIKNFASIDTVSDSLSDVQEIAGLGISALFCGELLLAGSAALMERHGIDFVPPDETGTAVHVAESGKYLGCIIISDEIKSDSAEAIAKLKELGIVSTVMLTGDERRTGEAVGKSLGMDRIYSQLLPQDKLNILEQLIGENASNGALAYVGDGINDAPSLSRADVGIAMGALGSDAAIEAADVVLMDDNPSKLPIAVSIARKTKNIAAQNITFSLVVKFAVLILGAFGLAGMWAAAFADVGVCVIAILNAMRTLR